MPRISIEIEDEARYAEFLIMAGTFLSGSTPGMASTTASPNRDPWEPGDSALAEQVIRKMTAPARRIFGLLAAGNGDTVEGKWSVPALTEMIGLNNSNELAGMLAWPGRYCYAVGRTLPFLWEGTEAGAAYWMEPEVATLFNDALRSVDPGLWEQLQQR